MHTILRLLIGISILGLFAAFVGACAPPRVQATPDGGVGGGPGGPGGGNKPPCQGLECQIVDCAKMGLPPTTISGKVFAPEGTLPVAYVSVYVPNSPLAPTKDGVSGCDACSGTLSGTPVVKTLTGTDGEFVLTNVPVTPNMPLVIQVGKFRRVLQFPSGVPACQTTRIDDPQKTRLPRNRSEGDMPKIAIATGLVDPFECLLLKLGLGDEIQNARAGDSGRIHFYNMNGLDMVPPAPKANDPAEGLLMSVAKLKEYDVVILPCEGSENVDNKEQFFDNVVKYADEGGRVFVTHYSYTYLVRGGEPAAAPFPDLGKWTPGSMSLSYPGTFMGSIDTSFPKGQGFKEWLGNVGALEGTGNLPIEEPRADIRSVLDPPSKQWIVSANSTPKVVQHFTFNTPLMGGPLDELGNRIPCGRVVFSDFHVSKAAATATTFPDACTAGPLTPEEKALAFMLFDLSACIQNDNIPPIP